MAYTPEQLRNIQIAIGLSRPYSQRVRRALIEAMGVESNFRNLHYGDRDSVGVLQQRRQYYPNSGKNVAYDIRQFLTRAVRNDRGFRGTAGQLAQSVQRSAFPGRYDQRLAQANALLSMYGGASRRTLNLGGGRQILPGLQSTGGDNRAALRSFLSSNLSSFAATGHVDPNAGTNLLMALQQGGSNQASDPGASSGLSPHPTLHSGRGGVTEFGGKPVATWIAGILGRARAAGWKGQVESGYRSIAEQRRIYNSGVRPAARPGQSNHNFTAFPGGAVDVSQAAQLAAVLRRLGIHKLVWAGAKDPVHFSHPHNGGY